MRLAVARVSIVVAAVGVGVLHGVLKEPPRREQVGYVQDRLATAGQWKGRYPENLELTLLDGSTFRMAEAVGESVVVLNFWATWCEPCRREMPELQRFVASLEEAPLQFIAVDAAEEEPTVRGFLEEEGLDLPVAIADQSTLQSMGVVTFPTTVVVGASGRISLYEQGAILNAEVALEPVVSEEIAKLEAGDGVTSEEYLSALEVQEPLPGFEPPEPRLEGRPRVIAEKMTCPCGCSDSVWECGCNTAESIVSELDAMALDGREDTEIITELNARFCVGSSE